MSTPTQSKIKIDPMKNSLLKLIACSFVTVLFMFSISMVNAQATLTTDATDYPPGGTVTLTGSGFWGGETVALQVLHVDSLGDNDSSDAHQPWDVVADDLGNFTATWLVPADEDELGATLTATADGKHQHCMLKRCLQMTPIPLILQASVLPLHRILM